MTKYIFCYLQALVRAVCDNNMCAQWLIQIITNIVKLYFFNGCHANSCNNLGPN